MCCENCCDAFDDDANVTDLENEIQDLKDEIEGLEQQLFNDVNPKILAYIHAMPHDPRCFVEYAGCICIKNLVGQ